MKRFFSFLLLLIAVAAPVVLHGSSKQIRYIWNNGRRNLSLRDIAAFYGMTYSANQKTVYLTSRSRRMSFTLNKRLAVLNGTNATTLFPVIPGKYDSFLSEHDFRYVLEPVMRTRSLTRRKIQTILLDPGHGGQDKGAPCANGHTEKEVALALTRKVAALLHARGFTVYMTRSNDRTLSLDRRTVITGKIRPDLFISIHCNAANKTIQGTETFAATPKDAPSSSDSKIGTTATPSNPYNMHNYRLAYEVQTALRKEVKTPDRGIKHARFYVIRNAACPAVLIEAGFVSNPSECNRLFSEWGRNQIAAAITNGILNYCRAVR